MNQDYDYVSELRSNVQQAIDRLRYQIVRTEELLAYLEAKSAEPVECCTLEPPTRDASSGKASSG